MLTESLFHCNCTCEGLVFIQGCSDPPAMHCNTGFSKVHSPMLNAGATAIAPVKVCCTYRGAVPNHQCTGFGKIHSPLLSAALQNRLAAGLCHCNCNCEDLLFIQMCSLLPPMHCNTGFGRMHSSLLSAVLQKRLTEGLYHCNHTYEGLVTCLYGPLATCQQASL